MVVTFTEDFILLFCEKNSDGTKKCDLRGNVLQSRIFQRIEDGDMSKIVDFLIKHPEVRDLLLPYNKITDIGLEILVEEYLKKPHTLLHLNLMGNDIEARGIIKLCEVGENLTLETLRVNGNKFGPEGGKSLALLLRCNINLKHLDISETDQTLASIAYVTSTLHYNVGLNQTLTVLDISGIIPLYDRYVLDSAHLAETIGDMLKFNTSLIEMHSRKSRFSGHDIEIMLIGLYHNKTLLFLDIAQNNISDYGIKHISNYLKTRPNLLGLNVSSNGIGNNGAIALSFGLPYSKIRLLDIGNNNISDGGMQSILFTIKKPYILRYFYIWGNKITHKTIAIFDRMIAAGVWDKNFLDIKIYKVNGTLYIAENSYKPYRNNFYCERDYNIPIAVKHDAPDTHILENKIKYNKIKQYSKPPKVDLTFYPKLPPLN